MPSKRVTEWQPVAAIPAELTTETSRALDRVDDFRERWRRFVQSATEEEIEERRSRNLRRHAIETGIIERLYDVSWGVTEELVAEGISLDVAEREGEVSVDTLATINAQLEGLNLLVSYVRENREFSTSFIRELHSAITATQLTYDAHDQFGVPVQVTLNHGAWKTSDNHVTRPDGSMLEYTPAIFVQDEIDQIVSLYNQYLGASHHPILLAAWLHHRFIRVHPFADGNGRVARALTLLVLLQKEYTPLVVRRETREEYIEALDRANDGDLEPLVRLFARLEEYAILAELEIRSTRVATTAVQVASEYAKRLKAQLESSDLERSKAVGQLAEDLLERIHSTFESTALELKDTLSTIDNRCSVWVRSAKPPQEESKYWKAEIIRAAREVDFYANIQSGTWWSNLTVRLMDTGMRYAAVIQKVGHGETGILAITFFAETLVARGNRTTEDSDSASHPLLRLRPSDSITVLHTENADEIWPILHEAINKTMTAALTEYLDMIG